MNEEQGTESVTPEQFKTLQNQLDNYKNQFESLTQERDKFKTKHEEAEKHRKQREFEKRQLEEDAARKGGDIEALENSWNEKYSSFKDSASKEIEHLNSIINSVTVGAEAKQLASELAIDGASGVLLPHIQQRLAMDLVDGSPVIKVKDKDGRLSASSIDDLKKEFISNESFATILKGSSANGSGNIKKAQGGSNTMSRTNFDNLNHVEKSRFIKEGGSIND